MTSFDTSIISKFQVPWISVLSLVQRNSIAKFSSMIIDHTLQMWEIKKLKNTGILNLLFQGSDKSPVLLNRMVAV